MMSRIIAFFLTLITFFGGFFNFYRPGKDAEFTAEYESGERDMDKYRGVYSYVDDCGGVPALFINGEPLPAAAYMTYLEEFNNYDKFARAGYNLFSVPVLFAGRWINANETGKPFTAGIFDKKDAPDYSALDASIEKIISACPGAYIFPRVNVSMPLWWIEENPDCLDGTGRRESLFSDKFRETAAEMLRKTIEHISQSEYASHIVGYQIAGGNTEEWFHFDLNAGFCKNAEGAFNAYLKKKYPDCKFAGIPDLSALGGKGPYHKNEHLARYLEFASNAVADDICYLSSVAKEACGGNLAVGTFYGYSLEVSSPLYGTHALRTILECPDIDFICSPNSYIDNRSADIDWTEMYPADSVRLHGKVCMQECDIRTHLTGLLSEHGGCDEGQYNGPIWQPLKSAEQTQSALRKSFARQLIKGNGFWWFDMWGGWYDSPAILAEMAQMREIYASSLSKEDRKSTAEVAVFVDESAYKYMTDCALRSAPFNMRRALGSAGAPYDLYDVSDFEAVCEKYKAVIFLSELRTEYMTKALDICKKNKIPYISASNLKKDYTAAEIRAFYEANGIHIYCDSGDIVCVSDNYLAVHSSQEGEKIIRLKSERSYRELLENEGITGRGDMIRIEMKADETKLFELI